MKSRKLNMEYEYKGIFHEGDMVICINNEKIIFSLENGKLVLGEYNTSWDDCGEYLEVGRKYKVDSFDTTNSQRAKIWIHLNDNGDNVDWFYPDRFINIKKERKKKLKKILKNTENP